MQAIVNQSELPKHRATECLNALVHSKDVIKVNKKVRSVYTCALRDLCSILNLYKTKGSIMPVQAGLCAIPFSTGTNQIIHFNQIPLIR